MNITSDDYADCNDMCNNIRSNGFMRSLICSRIESKHEVTILGGLNEFIVKFHGPQGSKCQVFLKMFFDIFLK